MKRARTAHTPARSPDARSGYFGAAVQRQASAKRSPHNICDRCGHFRSEHLGKRGGKCRHSGCECEAMVYEKPAAKRSQRFTAEEVAEAQRMIKAGWTCADVARKLGHTRRAVEGRFALCTKPERPPRELGAAAIVSRLFADG